MAQTPRRNGNARRAANHRQPVQNQPMQNGAQRNTGAYYTQNPSGNQTGQRLTPAQRKAESRS